MAERATLFVVRVSREDSVSTPFRARIMTADLEPRGPAHTTSTASPQEVIEKLREWPAYLESS
jgi:hypothetical protein